MIKIKPHHFLIINLSIAVFILSLALVSAAVNIGINDGQIAGVVIEKTPTNSTYGEMFMRNEAGLTIPIGAINTYYNITDFQAGDLNNVLFNGNETLTIQKEGIYSVDYSISFAGGGSDLYGVTLAVNSKVQNDTYIHRKLGSSGDVGNAGGTGIIHLNIGDKINLWIEDESSSGPGSAASIHMANVKIIKIQSIEVNGQVITNLNDLGDVEVTTAGDGNILTYNSTSGEWYANDLLADDNIWTGTNTFNDDVTFAEEINGDVVRYTFFRNENIILNSATKPDVTLGFGGIKNPISNSYGYLLNGAGSIKEFGCQYDVTAQGGGGFPTLRINVMFDTIDETNFGIATGVANLQEGRTTEVRDTSTYADSEVMAMKFHLQGFGGTPTLTLRRITCDVELYKDD